MDGNGQNVTRLTNQAGYDTWPTWSPDGSLILFTSARDTGQNFYCMTMKDLRIKRITYTQSPNLPGVWSPDGRSIAYASGISGAETEIYLSDTNGNKLTRLTTNGQPDYAPAWSPDGSLLAFYSGKTLLNQIYLMSNSGVNQTRITDSPFGSVNPQWNPEGDKLAFVRFTRELGLRSELCLMSADGSNQTKLLVHNDIYHTVSFVWSPYGDFLVSSKMDSAHLQIYKTNITTLASTNLSNSDADDTAPTCSPDGQWIAFVSTRDGNKEIYVMRNNGSELMRLTQNSSVDDFPVFSHTIYK